MTMSGSAPMRCAMFSATTAFARALGFSRDSLTLPYLSSFSMTLRYCAGTRVLLARRLAARCISSKLCKLPNPGATTGI